MAPKLAVAALLVLAVVAAGRPGTADAGQPAIAAHNSHNKYGTPLDTLMSTHLWADTAPAQDFVKETRPDPRTLKFAPLTGADPERPKPRDKANVEALQAELEQSRATNERRGGTVGGARRSSRKAKAATAAR